MKFAAILLVALAAASARADRILLIPLDSRPAAGQFAQMIGAIAGADVRMPPYETLGRFTTPGRPERILAWLESQDLSDVSAVVASADMLAYGGLVASRLNEVDPASAMMRLKRFVRIFDRSPKTKVYVFTSVMRLAPTATRMAAPWRMSLANYFENRDRFIRTGNPKAKRDMDRSRALVPTKELEAYAATRSRNHQVQAGLVTLAARRDIDYLVMGQDDAKQYGPFVGETARLKGLAAKLDVSANVFFCEGIDQLSSMLVSRAILRQRGFAPRVRVVYSDEAAKRRYADYESKPIEASLSDQILASGARPVGPDGVADYNLYLNVPDRREEPFRAFLSALDADLAAGVPCAVADINLGPVQTADPELFQFLTSEGRMMRLLSFAGWNTAGNTMGTAIPAANLYLLAKQAGTDPLGTEIAQKEFLLHRLANDVAYHVYTRPQAYAMIDGDRRASREETYGEAFAEINDFVRRDMAKHVRRAFDSQFLPYRFTAGGKSYRFRDVEDVRVVLPWPRVYEVRLSFRLAVEPDPAQ